MEQYRRAGYTLDSQSVTPHFAYANVLAGILKTMSWLLHVEFRAAKDAPGWDPSVYACNIFNSGAKAGRLYLDMLPMRAGIHGSPSQALCPASPEKVGFDALLKSKYARFNPAEFLEGNRFYDSLRHLTGYSSNYYTYVFEKVMP